MADDVLEIRKMTVEEVKENPPLLDRKFILINSSLYTDEAYEYVLELVNETDSIAFIRDRRQIYTHGEYFGGDIWEDRLFYFSNFQLLNDSEEEISNIAAEVANETIRFQGINNIKLIAEEYFANGNKIKTLKFGYDIANSIDNSVVKIDDSTAEYNLEIKDEKISINKYIPIRIELSGDDSLIEYYNTPDEISFNMNVFGTLENRSIFVTSGTNEIITVSDDYSLVTATISENVNTNYLVLYSDGKTEGSVTWTRKFGYGLCYSIEEITQNNFRELDRFVTDNSCECTFTIEQNEDEFGWFTCPSICTPIFIDENSGIRGGWKKYSTINPYNSLNIEYTVWRTENSGLGKNTWTIKEI